MRLLILAIPMLASAAPAAAPPLPDAKAEVDRIYAGLPAARDWRNARFAPALRRLLDREARAAGGEVGLLDSNPFCDCQDLSERYAFSSRVHGTADRATVHVALHNPGARAFRIELVRHGAGWAIADIGTDGRPSLAAYLRRNLPRSPR
jgi:hypothetical protein